MKSLIPMDDYGVFVDKHDTARVDSRYVAQFFEKEHRAVLRDIRELDCSEEFRLHNFVQSAYINEQGHKQPCYIMTRDGFVFLAMGYRGKKAAQFKELYIRRFNEMESFIRTLVSARQEFPLLTENIRLINDNPKPYHFSNECDMLNRIVHCRAPFLCVPHTIPDDAFSSENLELTAADQYQPFAELQAY